MRRARFFTTSLLLVAYFLSPTLGQQPKAVRWVPLEEGKLYLNVGSVDTASLPNLLGADEPTLAPGRAYVLQLTDPITPQRRAALTEAGVVLGDYLPRHAYTISPNDVDVASLSRLPFVSWLGEYQQEWKLDPELGRRVVATPARKALVEGGKLPVLITLFRGQGDDAVRTAIQGMNGAVIHTTEMVGGNPVISATLPKDEVQSLADLDAVQYVEEAPEITLRNSTDRWIVQSNVLAVTPLYDNGLRGEGQIVGVLDGRPDQNHCSLNGGKILAFNATATPVSDHGTHVSATAVGDNGVFDNTRGVAYLGNMVFNTIPSFTEAGVTARLELHASQGARDHTNSWGDDGTTSYNSLARGFDVFLHENEENFVCLAVTNQLDLRNPENAKNLLAVGATFDTPSQSSHCTGGIGPTADGRRKPEIYAPGCNTLSADGLTSCGTRFMSGTSMASPAVAGTAALVRQYYDEGFYPTGVATPADAFTPSGALIKATLLNSAVDMTGVTGYPSNLEGWGRVLADNALFFPGDARKLIVFDDLRNASGRTTGQTDTFLFQVDGGSEQLRVTLVWTDAPAAANTGTGFAAVNDLDLEVIAPNATLFLGNVFSGGASVSGGTKDDRNNVEQVHVNASETGLWTIRVQAAAVNRGPQGYALIATGEVSPNVPVSCTNGDLNQDSLVDGGDVQRFTDVLVDGGGSAEEICAGDLGSVPDGAIGMDDVPNFVACLLASGCPEP